MNKLNKILAIITFFYSFIIYLMTMAPTASFWDCGEFIATSVIMGVPHPPGSPLYLLLGNVFSQIPIFSDIGARVNLMSPIVSAFAVMFLYLIIVQLVEEWRGKVENISDAIIAYGGGFIGACTFAVTDSHWFNAVEAEVYSLSTFFTAIVVWLILKWNAEDDNKGERYILIIGYMLGLATGIHLLNLLTLPFIALIIYFKKYNYSHMGLSYAIGLTLISFIIIYLGIIKGIPNLANSYGLYLTIAIVLSIFPIAYYFIFIIKNTTASTIISFFALILIGFSTYSTIFIRASQHPNINENNPDTLKGALAYMNRDQYGDWSIIDRASTIKRDENAYWSRYTNNKSNPSTLEVINFVIKYQFNEMYLRYFLWQFAGKEDYESRTWEINTLDGNTLKKLQGVNWFRYGLPLALLFGLAGLGHHFYKDSKRAFALLALFLATGVMIIIYLNQYDPQPRERDYSFVGSFFAFSIWISIGIAGLLEKIEQILSNKNKLHYISISIIFSMLFAMPLNMAIRDYHEHDRTGNYVAWDYAYNMLNSCEPNGIIFTNGDNDTFPLWYIQEVEKIRTDVRVVNLSLLNTPWYIEQLKNQEPKIPISIPDEYIDKIDPITGTALTLEKWTTEWDDLKLQLNKYFREKLGLRYSVSDHGIPIKWEKINANLNLYGKQIDFELNPTISNYVRVQDFMVLQLLNDVDESRPVYFAVTVSPSNRMGLEKYLEMEGLVYKVTNIKTKDGNISPRLNYDKMKNNITQTSQPDFIVKNPVDYKKHTQKNEGMYRYTNLDNETVYFNSNIKRLIQNYRSGFLQLALEDLYSEEKDSNSKTIDLLNKMDSYFPTNVIPISEPDLDIQIGRIYAQAGNIGELKSRLSKLENRSDLELEDLFYIGQVYMNELSDFKLAKKLFNKLKYEYPMVPDIRYALIQIYSQQDSTRLAIREIDDWLYLSPNDEKAINMKDYLNSTLN